MLLSHVLRLTVHITHMIQRCRIYIIPHNSFPYPIIKVIFIEKHVFDFFISNPILAKKEALLATISIRNEKYTPKLGKIVG